MGAAWQCMRSHKQQRTGKHTKEAISWHVHSGFSLHSVTSMTQKLNDLRASVLTLIKGERGVCQKQVYFLALCVIRVAADKDI